MKLLDTRRELEKYLSAQGLNRCDCSIAVEGLIFDADDKLVLLLRGPATRDEHYKLEGIGGRFEKEDKSLIACLQREIKEEIGMPTHVGAECADAQVDISRLLEVRQVSFRDSRDKLVDWIVVSMLCRMRSGLAYNREAPKHLGICRLSLTELMNWPVEIERDHEDRIVRPGLSASLVAGREAYKKIYGLTPYYQIPDQAVDD